MDVAHHLAMLVNPSMCISIDDNKNYYQSATNINYAQLNNPTAALILFI